VCKDEAAFVADVTIPDFAHFESREAFTKTWRVRNVGTCTWTPEYTAVYLSGERLGGPLTAPLSATAPGATADISMDLAAPASDGTYKLFYQLHNADGLPMPIDAGDSIWTIITVGKTLVYPSATPQTSGQAGGCVTQSNADFAAQMVTLVNAARAVNGLPALTSAAQLNAAAEAHSIDMACTGSLSHIGSDGSQPAARVAAAGFSASITRENIYAQPPQYGGNPQAAMEWWLTSQIHREAVLHADVTQLGVGYAYYSGSPLGGYFTLLFAGP
jgi:uncharacterized protein YkwD